MRGKDRRKMLRMRRPRPRRRAAGKTR
eukprot:COSAG06_NODE_60206_length_271_cov_1.470930_1_plen_26_part_10